MTTVMEKVLAAEARHARGLHTALSRAEVLTGAFEDPRWHFVRTVDFARFGPIPAQGDEGSNPAAILARAFAIRSIKDGLGHSAVFGRLHALRVFAELVPPSLDAWTRPQTTAMTGVLKEIKSFGGATAYARAAALSKFFDYLNSIQWNVGGTLVHFVQRPIRWSHGIENIAHKRANPTTEEFAAHTAKKHVPDLDRKLAIARVAFLLGEQHEPWRGFDRIRLEALVFSLAMGLRIGELVRLPANALSSEPASGVTTLKVSGLKGAGPAMRYVPDLWHDPFWEAFAYLLEATATPRMRAKEIERNGFAFIRRALEDAASLRPKQPNFWAQLRALSLDPARYFELSLFADAVGETPKRICDKRYAAALVDLPKLVTARFVNWLDERFEFWDWSTYAEERNDRRTGQRGRWQLSVNRIGLLAGCSHSSIAKARWFIEDLRSLLVKMSSCGCFSPDNSTLAKDRQKVTAAWVRVRAQALENRGGAGGVAVDMEKFCELLEARYRAQVARVLEVQPSSIAVGPLGANEEVVRLSDHLLVVWEGHFGRRESGRLIPRLVGRADFYNYLCTNSQKKTVFQRLDIRGDGGKVVSLTPHLLRHWATDAARRAGISQVLVDMWMGRKEPGDAYVHMSKTERAQQFRERYTEGNPPDDWLGRKVRDWADAGISDDAIASLIDSKLRAMHFLPWGACSRELTVSPCNKAMRCLRGFDDSKNACENYHVDTEDLKAKANIESLRQRYIRQLALLDASLCNLRSDFEREGNPDETLDQHVVFMRDMIRGCDYALSLYA